MSRSTTGPGAPLSVSVTIGSSGSVCLAAGFVQAVLGRARPGRCTWAERPDNAEAFDECLLGKAGQTAPGLFGA